MWAKCHFPQFLGRSPSLNATLWVLLIHREILLALPSWKLSILHQVHYIVCTWDFPNIKAFPFSLLTEPSCIFLKLPFLIGKKNSQILFTILCLFDLKVQLHIRLKALRYLRWSSKACPDDSCSGYSIVLPTSLCPTTPVGINLQISLPSSQAEHRRQISKIPHKHMYARQWDTLSPILYRAFLSLDDFLDQLSVALGRQRQPISSHMGVLLEYGLLNCPWFTTAFDTTHTSVQGN